MGHFTTRVTSWPSAHDDAPAFADTSRDDAITKSAGPAGITERFGVSPESTSTLLILVTVGFFVLQAIAFSFGVVGNFESLGEGAKQDLLNFLRSL